MSDETDPPPLRLRPRARPEAAKEAEGSASPAGGDEAPRLRLKPRLGPESAAAEPASTLVTGTKDEPPSEVPATPRLKPRLAVSRETSEVPEAAKPAETAAATMAEEATMPEPVSLKLKPKAAAEPAGVPPPPPPPPAPPRQPPPQSSATTPPVAREEVVGGEAAANEDDARVLRPKVPHLSVPMTSEDELTAVAASLPPPPGTYASRREAARRKQGKPSRLTVGLTILAMVVAIGGVGFGGYWFYQKMTAAPAVVQKPRSEDFTPPAVVTEATSVPGQLIERAHDALSARRSLEQERVDGVLEGRETTGERAIGARTPAELETALGGTGPKAPPTSQNSIVWNTPEPLRDPVIDQEPQMVVEQRPEPSAAFQAWVTALNVSGVFQGSPARALINGRTVREGAVMDEGLGIVFQGVNAADKVLIFEDATGALVGKRY